MSEKVKVTHVVLDIDETAVSTNPLCKIKNCDHLFTEVADINGGYSIDVHIRPHFYDFIKWCKDQKLEIIIYSNGTPEYVRAIVDRLFEGKEKPKFVLDRRHSINNGETKSLDRVEEFTKVEKRFLLAIDDSKKNFINDRVIYVKCWENDNINDRVLLDVIEMIKKNAFLLCTFFYQDFEFCNSTSISSPHLSTLSGNEYSPTEKNPPDSL